MRIAWPDIPQADRTPLVQPLLDIIRLQPERIQQLRREALAARFASRCGQRTGFPSIDGVLKGMRSHRSAWLRVLERRCVPLPTNRSEGPLRDSVKQRKISGARGANWAGGRGLRSPA